MKTLLILLATTVLALAQMPSVTLDARSTMIGHPSAKKGTIPVVGMSCDISAFTQASTDVIVICRFFDRGQNQQIYRATKKLSFTQSSRQSVAFSCEAKGPSVWVIQAYVGKQLVGWKTSENATQWENYGRTPLTDLDKPSDD
jgi:hypothetical protein